MTEALRSLIRSTDFSRQVAAAPLTALLAGTRQAVSVLSDRAAELDAHLNALKLVAQPLTAAAPQFSSPAAIVSGGVVREIAGVVTLPETYRTDAVHTSDGVIQAAVALAQATGTAITSTGDPLAILDSDTATAWQIDVTSGVEPLVNFPETGPVHGIHLAIDIRFDSPQFVSQLELGVAGSGVMLFRIESPDESAVYWQGLTWADPGALVFFQERAHTQAIRLHLIQPHSLWNGSQYHFRTSVHSLRLFDVEYEAAGAVLLPPITVNTTLLRPLVRGSGSLTLQVATADEWSVVEGPLTLPVVEAKEELTVSSDGTAALSHTPEALRWVRVRDAAGQGREIPLSDVILTGSLLKVPKGSSRVYVGYTYRPEALSVRVAMQRGETAWQSPVLSEVRFA